VQGQISEIYPMAGLMKYCAPMQQNIASVPHILNMLQQYVMIGVKQLMEGWG